MVKHVFAKMPFSKALTFGVHLFSTIPLVENPTGPCKVFDQSAATALNSAQALPMEFAAAMASDFIQVLGHSMCQDLLPFGGFP